MLARMDPKSYAEHWANESNHLSNTGLYRKLSKIAPMGRTLEVGSGIGLGTEALSASREVLALDNNAHLIEKARARLKASGAKAEIIETDVLTLSEEAAQAIQRFQPEVIVGWFLGSNADDQDKYVAPEIPHTERARKYREYIEDAMLVDPICQRSVEWIHLATRVGMLANVSTTFVKSEEKASYDKYVFLPKGFEVAEVEILDWSITGSTFCYVRAPNQNLMPGQAVPKVISVLAKRKSI